MGLARQAEEHNRPLKAVGAAMVEGKRHRHLDVGRRLRAGVPGSRHTRDYRAHLDVGPHVLNPCDAQVADNGFLGRSENDLLTGLRIVDDGEYVVVSMGIEPARLRSDGLHLRVAGARSALGAVHG